ncbi:hypothetical protein F5Y18DRAFT_421158 [Xylariaceae sp. FL1019]|nr:hypothetical protein F5Y18DRAFT_421158 [Xylariaceae sp. FL1019]
MISVQALRSNLMTLYLFTRSDFKTVVFPQAMFAFGLWCSGRTHDTECPFTEQDWIYKIFVILLWIWVHLLVEDLANQRLPLAILEDKVNKPWRPLPAGRLTPAEARTWLQSAVIIALVFSMCTGSLLPSTTLMTIIWLYNDLEGGSGGPCERNILNAAGLGCFGWGAVTILIGPCIDTRLLASWSLLIAAVVASTVHVQDLPDIKGDHASKRRTIPLVYGNILGRGSIAFLAPTCPRESINSSRQSTTDRVLLAEGAY